MPLQLQKCELEDMKIIESLMAILDIEHHVSTTYDWYARIMRALVADDIVRRDFVFLVYNAAGRERGVVRIKNVDGMYAECDFFLHTDVYNAEFFSMLDEAVSVTGVNSIFIEKQAISESESRFLKACGYRCVGARVDDKLSRERKVLSYVCEKTLHSGGMPTYI